MKYVLILSALLSGCATTEGQRHELEVVGGVVAAIVVTSVALSLKHDNPSPTPGPREIPVHH